MGLYLRNSPLPAVSIENKFPAQVKAGPCVSPSVKQMDDGVVIEAVLPPAFPLTPPAVNSHKLHLLVYFKRHRKEKKNRVMETQLSLDLTHRELV